ncbi:MAG: GNAT family N-acetyltransferase [Bacteroidota bacterium]
MSFLPFPVLETKRLRLRRTLASDAEAIFFLRTSPSVNALVKRPAPESLEDALEFIRLRREDTETGKSIYWSISLKDEPEMIGSITLWNFSEDRLTGEVGYDLHPDHQRKGIMQESLEAVIRYGFDTLKLEKIEAYTQVDNLPSQRLLRRNGFVLQVERRDDGNPKNRILVLHKDPDSQLDQ